MSVQDRESLNNDTTPDNHYKLLRKLGIFGLISGALLYSASDDLDSGVLFLAMSILFIIGSTISKATK